MRRLWAAGAAIVVCLALGELPALALDEASEPNAFTCPPGTDPDRPGPPGQAQPAGYGIEASFDGSAGRIIAFVPGVEGGPSETWAFDVCTNTWTRLTTGGEPPAGLGPSTLADDRGLVVALIEAVTEAGINTFDVWTYDLAVGRWAKRSAIPWIAGVGRPVYDPASGLIMALDPPERDQTATELWTYDLDRDAWHSVVLSGDGSGRDVDPLLIYDASVGRILAVDPATGRTWFIDAASGAWSSGQLAPGVEDSGWFAPRTLAAYDATSGRTIVVVGQRVIAYDAAADRWEVLFEEPASDGATVTGPGPVGGEAMVFDPVNHRLVVIGGGSASGWDTPSGWSDIGGVWAFGAQTREWIELIAPERICSEPVPWGEPTAERAPLPSIDPALVPDADGFVFEEVAPGVRRLVTDGVGHFPSAKYIHQARDMDELWVGDRGSVIVWSTTHGSDNDLGGNEEIWILGQEGVRSVCDVPERPSIAGSAGRVAPDGSTWSAAAVNGIQRDDGQSVERFLLDDRVNSFTITPDGRVWVATAHRAGAGAIFVIEPDAQGTPVADHALVAEPSANPSAEPSPADAAPG